MKFLKSMAVAAAFLITGGIALAAPPQSGATPAQTKAYQEQNMNNNGGTRADSHAKVYEQKGTVSEVNGSDLVLLRRSQSKEERTTFKLTPNTKREGTIAKGSQVSVYYRDHNGTRVATTVKSENWKG